METFWTKMSREKIISEASSDNQYHAIFRVFTSAAWTVPLPTQTWLVSVIFHYPGELFSFFGSSRSLNSLEITWGNGEFTSNWVNVYFMTESLVMNESLPKPQFLHLQNGDNIPSLSRLQWQDMWSFQHNACSLGGGPNKYEFPVSRLKSQGGRCSMSRALCGGWYKFCK